MIEGVPLEKFSTWEVNDPHDFRGGDHSLEFPFARLFY